MLEYITQLLKDFTQWWFDFLFWWPKMVFSYLMEGLAESFVVIADSVCVQACVAAFNGINSGISGIPPMVIYFADFFQIGYGFSLVVCAYIARFLIRRIPFIG